MRSVWRPVPRLQIGSVRGGASTCSAFWPKNSASGVPCQRCMGDCIDWGTPISVPDHAIAALIRRCKPLFGALGRLTEIAAAHPGTQLRVFYLDEPRFGQQGTTTHVWAATGSRPTPIRQTEYHYLWVLGAVRPDTGQAEGLLSPRLNTTVVNLFWEQFSAA